MNKDRANLTWDFSNSEALHEVQARDMNPPELAAGGLRAKALMKEDDQIFKGRARKWHGQNRLHQIATFS